MARISVPRLRYRFGKLTVWNKLQVVAGFVTIVGFFVGLISFVVPSHVTLSERQISMISNRLAEQTSDKDIQIKALESALGYLVQSDAHSVKKALELVEKGRTKEAQLLLTELAKRSLKTSANAYRHLGALHFARNTRRVFRPTKEAVNLLL